MTDLSDKRILLGVTGGIAAYKAASLVRRLREADAVVRVVLTAGGGSFISALTLQALSGNPVRSELLDPCAEAGMDHIELARWAELVLVAPASAGFLARLAHGFASDLLATLCLATRAPVLVAPAMNQAMWLNPATQDNVALLRQHAVTLLGPATGEQACGEQGPGRMLEPVQLVTLVKRHLSPLPLAGAKVLITAGPTREPLDPVRFIGNRSSGKMGYALARSLAESGATVVLVSGPVALEVPAAVEAVQVETALEMQAAVMRRVGTSDLFVATAAVADYRPLQVREEKIKKGRGEIQLTLVKNPDILAAVAGLPQAPFSVGFAAETEAVEAHAVGKLRAKGLDMIAANRVGMSRGGFESDDNALTVFWEGGRAELPMMPKPQLADHLAQLIIERYHAQDSA